ncbi:MAG: hypothetical protein M3179_02655 [Actinomycetota bacterium]|nr:hypothetical protein [Actinomycetota bacterium]
MNEDSAPISRDRFEGLDRWLADARAREAAEARVRERWLRQQAEEEGAFDAVLFDLAERQADVVVVSEAGNRHVGRIEAVGDDFVAVRTTGRRLVLVALHAVAQVRAPRTAAAATTRREDGAAPEAGRRVSVTLADVLARAAGERPRLQVRTAGATLTGHLRAVGVDVVTVTADGDPPAVVYARVASLSEVSLLDSG